MAKRFTDSRKWYDPWFRKLPYAYKLFWYYITDTCDHAGFWKVDFEMASFCIGDDIKPEEVLQTFNTNEKVRIKPIKNDIWWLPSFIEFQYGKLNPNNNLHKSIILKIKTSGARQGLGRGSPAPMVKDKDKDKVKDKNNIKIINNDTTKNKISNNARLTDKDFIESLGKNPAYKHINLEKEFGKMDAWLSTRPGRKKTQRFIVNWLNKVEGSVQTPKAKTRRVMSAADLVKQYEKENAET